MADVRALLKAKRQEARISHPYASYTAAGQLKCTVCSAPVKHASAWEGHLGSKAHRTNVIRMREEEERQRRLAAQKEAEVDEGDGGEDEDADGEMDDEREESRMAPGKRRASEDEDAGSPAEKKRKVEAGQSSTSGGFPQDFFSDPSRGPILLPENDDDDDDEGDANGAADASTSQTTATAAPAAPKNEVDLEYERFQRELLATAATVSSSDKQETFQRATVFAEPVAASTDVAGFPPTNAPEPAEAAPQEVTEEEARQKKEQEERELIMDRLLEEERAQEDADTKVQMLKNRIEALRKKREQAKVKKATASSKAS